MQLYVRQRDLPELSRWRDAVEYYPHRESLFFSKKPTEESVYLRLDEALFLRPSQASFHLHKDFALFWLGKNGAEHLPKVATGRRIYTFFNDIPAHEACKNLPYSSIKRIGAFWRDPEPDKLLVLSQRQSCDILIAQNPESFLHLIFKESGQHFSMAAELHDFDAFKLLKSLDLLRQITESDRFSLEGWREALLKNCDSYSFFARHYDSYMSHVDYDLWIKRLVGWQKQYGGEGKKALELACGTANLASRLILEGYQVDAADISPQMLMYAAKKEIKPHLYQASLTEPIPGRDYDLIFCLFDSINYLLSIREIVQCLEQVHLALKPGGVFIFDISTLQNSLENFASHCSYEFSQDQHLVHEAFYEAQRQRQFSRLSYFERAGAGYTLQRELHQQRVYFVSELVSLIQESPLQLLAVRSISGKTNLLNKRTNSLDRQYHRLFFILGKNASAV